MIANLCWNTTEISHSKYSSHHIRRMVYNNKWDGDNEKEMERERNEVEREREWEENERKD